MVIVCPNCSVSYHIAAESLGGRGRTVRCTQCRHSWHVPGSGAIVEEETAPSVVAAAPETDAGIHDPVTADSADSDGTEQPTYPILPTQSVEDVETAARREFPAPGQRPRAKARKAAPRKPWPRLNLAQVIVVVGAVALTLAAVWRDRIVSYVPDAAAIYGVVGLPANPRGMIFDNLATSEVVENGVPMLVVSGSVQNIVDRTTAVPRLRLAVLGPTGREIYVWTTMPSRSNLLPGESLSFWSQLASPPAEGREVSVRFLSSRDIALGPTYRVDP